MSNPVDPVNCEVEERKYWPLLSGDDTYNEILERLRGSTGYQVLYLGFNNGTKFFGNTSVPFIMVTTGDPGQTAMPPDSGPIRSPILDAMSISDQSGNFYTPYLSSIAEELYAASDGNQYEYYTTTFFMNGEVDMTQRYNVQIDNTNVYATDGTQLDKAYYLTVWDESNASGQAMDPLYGLSSRVLCDFSAKTEHWSWHVGNSSGDVRTDLGVYAVQCQLPQDVSRMIYFKRYPHLLPEGDFAARVSVEYPNTDPDAPEDFRVGLYACNEEGDPIAVIMVASNGWLWCFSRGASETEMRRIREDSVPDFSPDSAALALRLEGPMMCYCVNGAVFARENVSGYDITNAGVLVVTDRWDGAQTVYFDDFEIAY